MMSGAARRGLEGTEKMEAETGSGEPDEREKGLT
jgi:hypothetical protein